MLNPMQQTSNLELKRKYNHTGKKKLHFCNLKFRLQKLSCGEKTVRDTKLKLVPNIPLHVPFLLHAQTYLKNN